VAVVEPQADPRPRGALDGEPGVARATRASYLVRLKLRLLRNGFRGQPWRVVAFVFGLLFGLYLGGLGGLGLAASGTADLEVGYLVAVFAGSALGLGWTLVPLLFFGVDETLDPARFALLPGRRGLLLRGMLGAAFVGVPAFATVLGSSGLVVAAALRFGTVPAVVAAAGAFAGLLLGIVASRAVTSAFATMLRSRRVRDLAILVIALLASSIAPLQLFIASAVQGGDLDQALRVSRVLALTPFGAPYALPFDLAAQDWTRVGIEAGVVVATLVLLLWWWSGTIESAMLGAAGSSAPSRVRPQHGGVVGTLLILPLRRLRRPSAFSAIVAREARFWWRDPRRRAGIVSVLVLSAVLPFVFTIHDSISEGPRLAGSLTFGFAVSMVGTLAGMQLANQFAFDGSAYAAHLLSAVPGRVEMRARAVAISLVSVPVQVAVIAGVAVLTGALGELPAGLGLLAAALGVSLAVAGLASVIAAYPMPESSNPFAVNSGGASARGLLAFVALLATLALTAPVTAASLLLDDVTGGPWIVLALGLGYGGFALWLGTLVVGGILDRRGPEVLAAVTPKR
jgi:ABC-2 type transport system permease protein